MLDYAFNKEKCIKQYESLGGGLSKEKVEVMRKKYGSNVLSEKKGKSFIFVLTFFQIWFFTISGIILIMHLIMDINAY